MAIRGTVFVFGYGSLVNIESLQRTIRRPLGAGDGPFDAQLAGWRRTWNVGTTVVSYPERAFARPDGTLFDGVTVWLGISRNRRSGCNGVVFRTTKADIANLDHRERLYRRTEVTDLVSWPGKPPGCTVYTYVPDSATRAVAREGVRRGTALTVEWYLTVIADGFTARGQDAYDEYRTSTPAPPCPVVDLVQINLETAPIRPNANPPPRPRGTRTAPAR